MGRFADALRRGFRSAQSGPEGERFVLAGKLVRCLHCGEYRFHQGSAQLNTAGLTFLNLDWANRSAVTLACVQCGRLEWFLQAPQPLEQ